MKSNTKLEDPKTVFEAEHKISPLGPQKVQNDSQIKSKSKINMEENIKDKVKVEVQSSISRGKTTDETALVQL